jgi:tetratricopeptide (TPR) repeat protein
MAAAEAIDAVTHGAADASWVLLERSWHALYQGANTGMLSQALSIALDAAQEAGRALEAGVMARLLGITHGQSGKLDLAEQLFSRAVEFADSAGLTESRAIDNANIAQVAMIRGDLSRARQAFTEGLPMLTGKERIHTVSSLIVLELQHGDLDAAERLLPEVAELATLADTLRALDIAIAIAGYHLARGAADVAAAQLADIIRTATVTGNKVALSEALVLQAAAYRDAGQLNDAEHTASEALCTARRQGCRRDEVAALDVLADVLTKRGRGEEGLRLLEQALTLSRESSLRYGECCTLLQLARTQLELGADSAAHAAATAAAELALTHEYRELARACAALWR